MPDPVTGVVAGSALLSYDASKSAASSAERSSAAELQFAQEQQQRFEDIYGPVEENLASYYNNLTPDYYAVQGLEAFQQEQQQALTTTRETLAQRGLSDSGVAAATEIAFGQQQAEQRAEIIREAPQQVAEQKLNFLSVGKGNAPTQNVQDVLSDQAAQARKDAATAATAAGQAAGQAAFQIATGLDKSNTTSQGVI